MNRIGGLASALFFALALAGPVSAHHSVQSQFDIHKTVSISGVVSKMEWINPHSYLTVNVKDADGKVQKWAFELGGSGALRRAGYQPGIIDDAQFQRGDYTNAPALVLSRCMNLSAAHLEAIATQVIPAGIHVYADADLPRVDFETSIDWQEIGSPTAGVPNLKAAFTAQLEACDAWFEPGSDTGN